MPKSPALSRTSGRQLIGTLKSSHRRLIPTARPNVEERCAAGVRDVGDVHAAACESPDQKAIDGAEGDVASLGRSRAPGTLIENPGELGRREVGVEPQTGLLDDFGLVPLLGELPAALGGAAVLPDDRVVNGMPVRRSQTTVVSR